MSQLGETETKYRVNTPGFDFRAVRSTLAANMVTQIRLAEVAGMSESYLRAILTGQTVPSVQARKNIRRGLRVLRLEPEEETVEGGESLAVTPAATQGEQNSDAEHRARCSASRATLGVMETLPV